MLVILNKTHKENIGCFLYILFFIYLIPDGWTQSGTGNVFSRIRIEYDSLLNLPVKCFGVDLQLMEDIAYPELYYELDTASDILNKFPLVSNLYPDGTKGIGYLEGLGEVWRVEGSFEYFFNKRLTGYVKDGDTVGTITPDSLLFLKTSENLTLNEMVTVFPNPAHNYLNLKITGGTDIQFITVEIKNLAGQIVLKKECWCNDNQIDISNLQKGMYIYTVLTEGEMLKSGKLILY